MSKDKSGTETVLNPDIPEWQRMMNLVPGTLVWVDFVAGEGMRATFSLTISSGPTIIAIKVVANVRDEITIPWHNVAAITPIKRKST